MVTCKLIPSQLEDYNMWGYKLSHRDRKPCPDWMQPMVEPRGIAHDVLEHIHSFSNQAGIYQPEIEEMIALGSVWFVRGHAGMLGNGYHSDEETMASDIAGMLEGIMYSKIPNVHYTGSEWWMSSFLRSLWDEILKCLDYDGRKWVRKHEREVKTLIRKCLLKGYRMAQKVYGSSDRASVLFSNVVDVLTPYTGYKGEWYSRTGKVDEYSPILYLTYNTKHPNLVTVTEHHLERIMTMVTTIDEAKRERINNALRGKRWLACAQNKREGLEHEFLILRMNLETNSYLVTRFDALDGGYELGMSLTLIEDAIRVYNVRASELGFHQLSFQV